MGSLSRCLKKAGLGAHEEAILRGAVEDYRAEGYEAHQAAVSAVMDHLEDLLAERADISGQITEQGGRAPAVVFSMDDARKIVGMEIKTPKPVEKPGDTAKAWRLPAGWTEATPGGMATSRGKPIVSGVILSLRSVANELRKAKTATSVADMVETASQRLYSAGYAVQSEVLDEIVDQLRGKVAEKSDAEPKKIVDGKIIYASDLTNYLDGTAASLLRDPENPPGRTRVTAKDGLEYIAQYAGRDGGLRFRFHLVAGQNAVDQSLADSVKKLTERGVRPEMIEQAVSEYKAGDDELLKDLERISVQTFNAGDTVRIHGEGSKVHTVESIGPDGWVYTRSGAANSPDKFYHANEKESTGGWGGEFSTPAEQGSISTPEEKPESEHKADDYDENNLDEPEGRDGWKRLDYIDGDDGIGYPVDYRDIRKVDGHGLNAIRQIRIYNPNRGSYMAVWEWNSKGFADGPIAGLRIDSAIFNYSMSDATQDAFGDYASDGDALWARYGQQITHALKKEAGTNTGTKSESSQPKDLERISAPKTNTAGSIEDAKTRHSVAMQVGTHLLGGGAFDTIVQGRSFVAKALGIDRIEPGTPAAKYADEIIEAGIVEAARGIVTTGRHGDKSPEQIYTLLTNLYERQPRLGVRTSTSMREQAYSTPAPLAYLASQLAGIDEHTHVYEPTAGNGMLLIGAKSMNILANELNQDRYDSLKQMFPTANIRQGDALSHDLKKGIVDAVIANPPFGIIKVNGETKVFETSVGYPTREIDHAIAFRALAALPDHGRAVLIVGGIRADSEEDRKDGYRGRAKREFYFNLYNNYNVTSHFTVNGDLYEKQGAGYPVDVIVINGRGQSERMLPAADLPVVYNSWGELKELLNENSNVGTRGSQRPVVDSGASEAGPDNGRGMDGRLGGSSAGDGIEGARPASSSPQSSSGTQSGGRGDTSGRSGQSGGADSSGRKSGTDSVDATAQSGVSADSNEQRQRTGTDGRSGELDGTGGNGTTPVTSSLSDRRGQEAETDKQVTYEPRSTSSAVGTLVPINMRDSVQKSLSDLEEQVGNIDDYVASRLNMSPSNLKGSFSAEQIDALAMAINNAEQGGGFIIGDQTGIGKGRVVAAMIHYAIQRNLTPVFVTEKPNLYADMLRDMKDIGMGKSMGYGTGDLRVLMTNSNEKVPYGDDGEFEIPRLGKASNATFKKMADDGIMPGKYKAIFTTYNQLQTQKGVVTDRMLAVQKIIPNAYLILDESHNAGGTGSEERMTAKQRTAAAVNGFAGGRAGFLRLLVQNGKASFFSSATYAKRPNVMDLYASTNMILAVDKPSQLGEAIARGGVPLQQIVATMLSQDGQYIRRERSFAGVTYDTGKITVEKEAAENMAQAMSRVLQFSRAKDAAVDAMQKDLDEEGAIASQMGNDAQKSVSGANFGSIMHNLIDQMLLALKARGAVDEALLALGRGEKVVLTVANTMGSFIADYAKSMGLNAGDPVNLTFNDLYRKYLEKQRWVRIKKMSGGGKSEVELYRLTDKDLGPQVVAMFKSIDDWLSSSNFGHSPISPIDYMHAELRKIKINGKKITTDEITGRSATINYEGKVPQLATRKATIKARLEAINGFNSGKIDVLIINQSGSTGLSLHASEKFKDQRKRHMIVVQAEKNIDTHMQLLGRVHRTGQVLTPAYTQLMADIPAEMRPAAVLSGKMAKLSANTTASKDSDFSADGVTDFINDYGGQVAVEYLLDNPDVYRALGGSDLMALDLDEAGEDQIRRLTGYIPLLPIAMQEKIYSEIVSRYNELIQRETEMGTNKLEARALDLDAKTLAHSIADPGKADSKSLFAAPVTIERVSIKRTSKPLTQEEVREVVKQRLGGKTAYNVAADMVEKLHKDSHEFEEIYRAKRIADGAEAPMVQAAVNILQGIHTLAVSRLQSYKIGTTHQIDMDGQIFYGIVTDVLHNKRAVNPAALSSWSVKFALVMADANAVTIPFSQLGAKFKTEAVNGTMWGDLASGDNKWVSIHQLFDVAQTSAREKRWMVTGNLLAGYAKFPGQLVHYTKDDGTTSQGILMSRAYDYDKHKEMLGSRMKTASKIMQFFSKAGYNSAITDQDQTLRIDQKNVGEFIFTIPSSKRKGGMYSLDSDLTDILGQDFVSASGGQMRVTVYDEDRAQEAINHVLGDQATYFTAVTHKDVAAKLNDEGDTPSVLRKSGAPSVAEFPGGIKAPAAEAIAARLIRALGAATKHKAVDTFFDLPQEVQADARAQGSDEKTTKGVLHKGTVYIVAGNVESSKDIEETVFHEVLGHEGMRKLLGPEFVQKMNALFAQLGGIVGLSKIAAENDFGPIFAEYVQGIAKARGENSERFTESIAKFILTEEIFAHMAEKAPTIYQKAKALIGWVRDWLRTKGFAKLAEYGETDILHLLNRARGALRDPNGNGPKGGNDAGVLRRAWHGSPHAFDKFDMNKLGSGEGNQAYGHGLYFASAKDVAESYKKTLGQQQTFQWRDEEDLLGIQLSTETRQEIVRQANTDKTAESAAKNVQYANALARDVDISKIEALISNWRSVKRGRLYEVELAPEENEYLDWDKPLNEQSETIKKSLTKALGSGAFDGGDWTMETFREQAIDALTGKEVNSIRGSSFYRFVQALVGGGSVHNVVKAENQKEASDRLAAIGIRGIRYLDGSSRDQGKGNSNYVIFDDKDIDVVSVMRRSPKQMANDLLNKREFPLPTTPAATTRPSNARCSPTSGARRPRKA